MWSQRFTVEPANGSDAHRRLLVGHHLAAILSHVEERVIANDYTFQFGPKRYQILKSSIVPRMRGSRVQMEVRLEGTLAARWEGKYLQIAHCAMRPPAEPQRARQPKRSGEQKVSRAWMDGFWERPSPPVRLAIRQSNRRS